MATTLGKRKRQLKDSKDKEETSDSENTSSSGLDAQEIFRRHFEAQFKPLPVVQKKSIEVDVLSDEETASESEWSGISDAEDGGVEVIEHTNAESRMAAMSKEELKSFMVCLFSPRSRYDTDATKGLQASQKCSNSSSSPR